MAHLTKDQILLAGDIKTEELDVPEWGGTILVRGLTGTDRDAWEMSLFSVDTSGEDVDMQATIENRRAKMVSRAVVDEQGNLLFSEADVERLGQKSALVLDRICNVINRLSGIGKDAEEKAAKNSSGRKSGSTSG